MRSMLKSAALAVSALMFIAQSSQAQGVQTIEVKKSGGDKNPTLCFKGVSGNQQLSNEVASDLKMCGWFDVVNDGSADFVVNGAASGNSLSLNFANAAGVTITTVSATGESADVASHKAVDAILKFNFKVEGICRTKIVFSAEVGPAKKEIYICDFDGTNFKKLTNNNALSVEPVWSPNGRSVIYSYIGKCDTDLIELDLASNRSRRLAQFPGLNAGGKLSPSCANVALILSKDNQIDLYTRSVNGTDLKRLTNDKGVEASPCWSPDGGKICFVSDNGNTGRPNLYMIGAGGGSARRMPTVGSEAVSPSWAKDNRIAYSAKLGNYAIAILDISGTSTHKTGVVVSDGGDWKCPAWAPDNRHVVAEHNGGLWVVDTWTGKSHQILGGKSKVALPDWSGILY